MTEIKLIKLLNDALTEACKKGDFSCTKDNIYKYIKDDGLKHTFTNMDDILYDELAARISLGNF